jgi:hypothetical protein
MDNVYVVLEVARKYLDFYQPTNVGVNSIKAKLIWIWPSFVVKSN